MQKTLTVINLNAIRANAQYVKDRLCGRKFFAVVKADAYGHGAEEVARCIEDLADCFCVAIADEGVALRVSGITKPILVLTPPLGRDDVQRCAYYNLTITVNSVKTATLSRGLPCHIKINTGMNRYGCDLKELKAILRITDKNDIRGVYSHLYAADNDAECDRQLKLFYPAVNAVKRVSNGAVAHIAASGGILKGDKFLFDGGRSGIMLYGYAPCGFEVSGLEPAMKVYAPLSQETAPVGGGVAYSVADKKYVKLGTVRAGYADGFARTVSLGEKALCMDAFVRDESHSQGDMHGAITFEGQKFVEVFSDAENYAARSGTISYEVLCSVSRRSLKIYER